MEYIIKYIVIGLVVGALTILTGCSDPEPMSQAEANAVEACIEAGHNPTFDIQTNGRRLFECGKVWK
jgi:hypothetical protein